MTSIHNRSAVVSTWSEESLDEIYALRLMLEGHAAELAANHATPSDADHLQSLATQMDERGSGRKAGYAEACAELNAQFHLSLVEASKSERLIKIASGLIELPLVRQAILARPWDEVLGSWSQHHMIVAAIRDHNGALAAALVRAHLLAGQNGLRRTLQTNGGRTAR